MDGIVGRCEPVDDDEGRLRHDKFTGVAQPPYPSAFRKACQHSHRAHKAVAELGRGLGISLRKIAQLALTLDGLARARSVSFCPLCLI